MCVKSSCVLCKPVCVCMCVCVCVCVCVPVASGRAQASPPLGLTPHHSHYTTPDAVQDLWQVQWSSAVVLSFYIHTISFRQRLLQRTTWLVLYVSIFYFEATG